MHADIQEYISDPKNIDIYYHREIIARSVDDFPIYMCTITSSQNILNTN